MVLFVFKVDFDEDALKDLEAMDGSVFDHFNKHFDKMAKKPPRRHLKHGVSFHTEEVGQGRIVYDMRNDTLYIVRCFTAHKEYEKWYKSL